MKLDFATFQYDKGDGSKPKDRNVLVLSKPSDSYFGVEFSDMSELAEMIAYMKEKHQMEEYLKHKYPSVEQMKYKRFKVSKIIQIQESKKAVV